MLLVFCTYQTPQVAPIPTIKNVIDTQAVPLSNVSLECVYEDTQQNCSERIFANFEFFKALLYPREVPFTPEEWKEEGEGVALSVVEARIASSAEAGYDIKTLDEWYQLNVTSEGIKIRSTNLFGFSRALASLVQLIDVYPRLPEVGQAYVLHLAEIEDKPAYPWRQLMLDGARHYISIQNLKRHIDALAIAKMNLLHLHAVDAESFPVKFDNAPESDFFKGTYHPKFYYSTKDFTELQDYAFTRGVFFYIELDMPGHAWAWGKAADGIVPECPNTVATNPNNVGLNMINDAIYPYIKGAINETGSLETRARPIVHLGGDEITSKCYNEDPAFKKYLDDNGVSVYDIWKQFHTRVYNDIADTFQGRQRPYQVYWDDVLNNGNSLDENAILHFWQSNDFSNATKANLPFFTSYGWYLDQMHPGDATPEYFNDLWKSFYAIDPAANLPEDKKGLLLGGGPCQWSEWVWGQSLEMHIYPRALAIAEVLWSSPADRTPTIQVQQRLDGLACKLRQAGIKSGSLGEGQPCLGERKI